MADVPVMLDPAWLKMSKKPVDQNELLAMSLKDTGIEQAPLAEMSTQAAPIEAPPAPKPAPAPNTQKNSGMGEEADALRSKLEDMRMSRMADEQSSIDDYGKKIAEYEARPTGIDWRPLAGLLDQWAGGKAALTAAEATKPEPPELKREKLAMMREKLSGMKGSLSKSQYDALKDQLDSIKSEQSLAASEKRLAASMGGKQDTMARLQERDIEKDVQKLSERMDGKAQFDTSLKILEDNLGFKVDDFDFNTGRARGKKVDLPGTSVPGIGRIAFYDEKARRIDDTMANIFNTILKDRSGAAVTNQELDRLRNEFSSGRFQTEAEKLQAIKDFKRATNDAWNRAESAFRPVVRETLKGRLSEVESKISPQKKKTPTAAEIDNMTPEQLKQYLSE